MGFVRILCEFNIAFLWLTNLVTDPEIVFVFKDPGAVKVRKKH